VRVLFVSQFFPPDTGGTAFMLGQLAEDLAREHDVHVVAGRASYDTSVGTYEPQGVTLTRVRTTRFSRRGMLGRICNYASFTLAAVCAACRSERPDVVVAMTDPPYNGLIGAAVAGWHRTPFVHISHDVYPDIAIAIGKLRNPALVAAWRAANRLVFRRAQRIVVVGRDMEQLLAARGAEPSKLVYLPSWGERQEEDRERTQRLRGEHGWDGAFVVMHAGNVGLAQNVELFADLAERLRADPGARVVVLGDGAGRPVLERAIATRRLRNLELLDAVPKPAAQALMAAADLHLVSLAPGLLGCAAPSKTYGIMAAARPFVAAVDPGSEPARIVEETGCGRSVPAGDASALAAAVRELRTAPLDAMGELGRIAFERRFERRLVTAQLQQLLEDVAARVPDAGTAGERRQLAVARALRHEAALEELLPALRQRGVRPLVIKGPVTARLLYDRPRERPYGDLDLLVAPGELAAAASALAGLGYRPLLGGVRETELGAQHAEAWRHERRIGVEVDLHHGLPLVEARERLLGILWRDSRRLEIGALVADAPGDGACALIVALHAAQHGDGWRRPLADLRRAVARLPIETWRDAASLAAELGVGPALAAGLARVEGGAELAAALGAAGTVSRQTRLMLRHASGGAQHLERALAAPTPVVALARLRDALFPSPALMRFANPGIGSNRVRLAAAYAARQARIPRALVDYARALADGGVRTPPETDPARALAETEPGPGERSGRESRSGGSPAPR
jgi:putative colanic acid biosynthesis glycosyltransferase WcaI